MMMLMIDVLPHWVLSLEDASRHRRRLQKHLLVLLAVLVGASTSGFIHAVEMPRTTTSGEELEQELKTSAAVDNGNEKSSTHPPPHLHPPHLHPPPPSMDTNLIESLFRSGFYSATFDRICQQQRQTTRRHLVTGPSSKDPGTEVTSEDRPHSTTTVYPSDPSSGGAIVPGGGAIVPGGGAIVPGGGTIVRVRRSTARRDKAKWNEILRANECKKLTNEKAKPKDPRSENSTKNNIDEVEEQCANEQRYLGCHPIPQVVHVTDLCNRLPVGFDAKDMRTIVYACPDISCCEKGHKCQVKTFAKVNKSFMVGDTKTITLQFRNHTECACAEPGLKSTTT